METNIISMRMMHSVCSRKYPCKNQKFKAQFALRPQPPSANRRASAEISRNSITLILSNLVLGTALSLGMIGQRRARSSMHKVNWAKIKEESAFRYRAREWIYLRERSSISATGANVRR